MSVIALILSIFTAVQVDIVYPDLFKDNIKFLPLGSLLIFIMIRFTTFGDFKKISGFLSWIPCYLVIFITQIHQNGLSTLVSFICGIIMLLFINTFIGNPSFILNPFKAMCITFPFQKPVTIFYSVYISISGVLILSHNYKYMIISLFSASIFTILFMTFESEIMSIIFMLKKSFGLLPEEEIRKNKLKILLADISIIWSRKNAVITLENLAQSSWLEPTQSKTEKVFSFSNPEIIYYWENNLPNFNISTKGKVVIGNILEYLDKFGDCSSVVSDKFNDKYKKFKENEVNLSTYDILSNYSLTTHSINVAKGLESKEFESFKTSAEWLIIAAFAHDLGKIQGNKDKKNYLTSDHPASSVMILETEIDEYSSYNAKEDISYIIVNHHRESGEDKPLTKAFRSLDAAARRFEVTQFIKEKQNKPVQAPIKIEESKKQLPEPPATTPPLPMTPPLPIITPMEEQVAVDEPKNVPDFTPQPVMNLNTVNPLFRDMVANSSQPEIMELPWIDLDKIINSINHEINKIEKGWFKAVTVNGDMVLVMTTYIFQLLKQQAKDAGDEDISGISNNDMDNPLKKSVLMSFVQLLWNKNYIHENWIKKGYYNANFILTDSAGNEPTGCNGWFVPMRIEAFNKYNTYDDYELRKSGKLKDIVSAKVPGKK